MATLNPSADTRLLSDGADTNYGSDTTFEVGEMTGQTSTRRSLVKFNLTSYTGMSATSAKLRLYDNNATVTNARTMEVYRSKRAWTEAGATWNKYDGSNAWGTAGSGNSTSDYDNNVVGSISLPANPTAGYVEITLNPSYINEWLAGTMTNNGFFLKMQTETDDGHTFNSNNAASNKPELVLNFDTGFMAFM